MLKLRKSKFYLGPLIPLRRRIYRNYVFQVLREQNFSKQTSFLGFDRCSPRVKICLKDQFPMKNKLIYLTHRIFRAPAIFAHPNFHAINFRATSPFSRTINFRAMIFDSFFLLNLLERVIHPRNHCRHKNSCYRIVSGSVLCHGR